MAEFRILTDEGVELFRDFLEESARSGGKAPTLLLIDRTYSTDCSHKNVSEYFLDFTFLDFKTVWGVVLYSYLLIL